MTPLYRPLGLETLEPRQVMAGNVAVTLVDGDLFITGDYASNRIIIEQTDEGVTRVRGENSAGSATRINGRPNGRFATRGEVFDVQIELASGNDFVRIQPSGGRDEADFLGSVAVNMDLGDDQLRLRDVSVGGDLLISDGNGRDIVAIFDSLVLGNLRITEPSDAFYGGGSNRYTFEDVSVQGQLEIHSVSRNDWVSLDAVAADEVFVSLATGDDRLNIRRSSARLSTLDGGPGIDQLNRFDNDGFDFSLGFERQTFRDAAI